MHYLPAHDGAHGKQSKSNAPSGSGGNGHIVRGGRSSARSRVLPLTRRLAIESRTWLLAIAHLVMFATIYWLAFALRFDFHIPEEWVRPLLMTLPWVVAIKLAVFYASGHYKGWWLYVTFADLTALLKAAVLSSAGIVAADHFFLPYYIPRVVLLLDGLMTVVLLGAVRGSGRMFLEQIWPAVRRKRLPAALLVGADRLMGLLAHQISCHPAFRYRICGLLSTRRGEEDRRLGQVPVLGHLRDLRQVAAAHGIRDILVVAGTLSGRRIRRLMDTCNDAQLTLRIIPPLEHLFNGNRWIPLREIEISDLLRRESVDLDARAIGALIEGRRILVTGAGGSIGSEVCRQVLRFQPAELVLLGRGENRLFSIERELQAMNTAAALHTVVGSITDEDRMRQVFEQYRPEIVFHTAAHKHVPMMENNVGEAVKNNVLGTKCVADLADEYESKCFALISTDKAVNPSSVLGATKYLAERYVQSSSAKSTTRFVVVRLGNVLGSAGSVVPVFQEQIRRGGPITVTDPRMARYFMTIPEASQLVLQATAMGQGGEVFVLDMGEPVKIVDLAQDLIRLSGLPAGAINITFSGIRAGEKLDEELYFGDEQMLPTAHPKVHVARHRLAGIGEIRQQLQTLEKTLHQSDELLRQALRDAVPEYRPLPHAPGDRDPAGAGARSVERCASRPENELTAP
jgi:FlaA1/EpsC-like NDP-sugar epimerase